MIEHTRNFHIFLLIWPSLHYHLKSSHRAAEMTPVQTLSLDYAAVSGDTQPDEKITICTNYMHGMFLSYVTVKNQFTEKGPSLKPPGEFQSCRFV